MGSLFTKIKWPSWVWNKKEEQLMIEYINIDKTNKKFDNDENSFGTVDKDFNHSEDENFCDDDLLIFSDEEEASEI